MIRPAPLEDYALLGDDRTAALVRRDGTIDWLCLPRFDSGACFAALVGEEDNGFWRIAPAVDNAHARRAYRRESLVLETVWECGDGRVRVVDALITTTDHSRLVRQVIGERGHVAMRSSVKFRYDYGSVVPWVYAIDGGTVAVAGPDAIALYADVPMHGEGRATVADFEIGAGECALFEMAYYASHERPPQPCAGREELEATDVRWREWTSRCTYNGPYREAVLRSLLTLKALQYTESGAICAAPTTSLPEKPGGVRNWDYRYCWIRDATFVLVALLNAGYRDEAQAWRQWLLRAVAGSPQDLQILYGLRGERRIPEFEATWLSGYDGARPVRVGNAASTQFQLDVYGEAVDVMYQALRGGIPSPTEMWSLTRAVIEATERRWTEPDQGLWEMRGEPQHFVHSKVLAWVALDRAVCFVEEFGFDGPIDRWRDTRDRIKAQVVREGYDTRRETFTQAYGSQALDAATLLIPLVGFLEPDDPRVASTICAIERELTRDGFVLRYSPRDASVDGFPPGEGAFLACNFWLADAYAISGRFDDAHTHFERLLAICNDVGLLAEEYDVHRKRLTGNFPQAFSHVGLVNTAFNLHAAEKPAEQRAHRPMPADERSASSSPP